MATVVLSTKAIGDIVKIKVNGTSREFIVVHKGKPSSIYDNSFNNGVILLMKDLYANKQWHNVNNNDYANSDIHTYLNNTFLNLIDADIRSQIVQVKIPYRAGSTGSTITSGASGLSAKIFLPANIEVGGNAPQDGAKWNYFDYGTETTAYNTKRIGYLNGTAAMWWLRSPADSGYARRVNTGGYLDTTATVANSYGVRPALVLPSSISVSDDGSVVTNQPPTTPSSITIPTTIKYNEAYNVTWGTATDADGNLSGYRLERQINGGTWTQIYQGTGTSYSQTLTRNQAATVNYRVKAYDAAGEESGYRTGTARTVTNNTDPVISGSDGALGAKNADFTQTYTVTDADSDAVTVTEKLDGTTLRTYTATLGATNTISFTGEAFKTVLNGSHTLTVTASDGTATSTRTWTFTKAINSGVLSLKTPLVTDAELSVALTTAMGNMPAGAEIKIELCNNAYDAAPTWEDATAAVLEARKHFFSNKKKTAAKWGFNFRLTLARGTASGDVNITSVGGNFK